MTVFTILLILAVILLIFILWRQQRQIKDICRQLAFLQKNESNMLVTAEINSGGIRKLVEILNEFLDRQKKNKKEFTRKENQISEIYTNLSHDIRTPLTSLDGYLQLLEESKDAEEQRRYTGIMRERISSLKDMLEELFTYTKLKNTDFHLELSSCRLNRILKETIFSYYEDWMEKGIQPDISITEEELTIEGNASALKRIIQNLIKNGLEHGEDHIGISLKKQGEWAALRLENKVKAPEEIDPSMVFERFYKADDARSQNSTGLGLSIAKEFVLRMNGTIEADLDGNVFGITIMLPSVKAGNKREGL